MIQTKICGLTTEPALAAALDNGATHVGFVFFAKSPRNISHTDAARLANIARGRCKIVALTVDADDAALNAIIEHVSPDVLQLHGHESPERTAAIRSRSGRPVWKAIPVATADDAAGASAYLPAADRILFDAKPPRGGAGPDGKSAPLPGGNGLAFDWSALDSMRGQFPFMLSGGLTSENVTDAIRATSPWGVDVSSGVETSPGVKDPELIQRFLRAVSNGSM